MLNLKSACLILVSFLPVFAFAQAINDYRSAATGNWNSLTTWERFQGAWATPTAVQGTPTNAANVITIRSGHTVTVTAAVTIDQTTIDLGGTVVVNNALSLTLNNGTAANDLTVNGTLNMLGESILAQTGGPRIVFGGNSDVRLGSLNATGAIVTGTGSGNIRVNLRTFNAGTRLHYVGTGPQFIGNGGATTGVHSFINNASGVSIAAGGAAPAIGGNLDILAGTLLVQNNSLTVNGDLNLVSSNLNLDGTLASRTLTVVGSINLTGGQLNVISLPGSDVNTILVIQGDIVGTNFISFSGANCRVTISGTTPTTFSRPFPINTPTTLEQLTIIRTGVTLEVDQPLTLGNTSTGGLLLTDGDLRMNASLTVTRDTDIVNGFLYFEDQVVTLQRNINTTIDASLSSNEGSTLNITSTSTITTNTLFFSPSGNTLGTLNFNRSSNNTPLVTLSSPLTISGSLYLTNGEFLNSSDLTMASGSQIVRTGQAAFAPLSNAPLGGPYNLVYNNYTTGVDGISTTTTSLTTGVEAQGSLNNLTSNVSGTITVANPITAVGALTINSGVFTSVANAISTGTLVNAGTFNAPSTTLTLTGNMINNGTFNRGTGTVQFNGTTVISGSNNPSFQNIAINGTLTSPPIFNIHGSFTNNGTFINPAGTINFIGAADQSISGSSATDLRTVNISNTAGTVSLNSSANLYGILTLPLATSRFDADGLGAGVLTVTSTSETQSGSIGSVATPTNFSGNVTVQRFMAAIGGDPFRYVASPIGNVAKPVGLGGLLSYNNGWSAYSGNMTLGAGYASYTGSQATWSVTGPSHTGDYTWSGLPLGWNLIGNPYPSIIDWKVAGWSSTNISNWIAVTDNSIIGYPNYFQYFDNTVSGPVAMCQAFWVYVTTGTGTLTITETAKTTTNVGKFFREGNDGQNRSIADEAFTVNLSNGNYIDQSFVQINGKAAGPKAQGQDFTKLFNQKMNVYFLDDKDREMLVHTLSDLPMEIKIPIGVKVSEPGEYDLSFANANTVGRQLYLIDEYEGEVVPLSDALHYSVQIKDASVPINARFRLSSSPELDRSAEASVEVYPNPAQDVLHIRVMGLKESGSATLMDIKGQILSAGNFKGNGTMDIANYPDGLYILRVKTNKGIVTRKIVKRGGL